MREMLKKEEKISLFSVNKENRDIFQFRWNYIWL